MTKLKGKALVKPANEYWAPPTKADLKRADLLSEIKGLTLKQKCENFRSLVAKVSLLDSELPAFLRQGLSALAKTNDLSKLTDHEIETHVRSKFRLVIVLESLQEAAIRQSTTAWEKVNGGIVPATGFQVIDTIDT